MLPSQHVTAVLRCSIELQVSLVPIICGDRSSVREAAISYWRDAVSVRSNTHRLVARRTRGNLEPIELYDLAEDLDSVHNIAAEEPELVQSLQRHLPE